MRRLVAVLLLAAAPALPQSLGEVAERSNKQRKGTPAKVYTNDDLNESHDAPEGKVASPAAPAPAAPAATPSGGASTAPAPAPTMDPAQRWRRDAKARRDAVARAEANVAAIQAKIDALLLDLNPTNVGDPNRLQTIEAEKAKALADLEMAKEELAQARQGVEDLEDEARKAGVPPGWLREP
jgi:hypothetical protein